MTHHLWFNTCVAGKDQANQEEGEGTDMARTLITLEDIEAVRKDVEPNMVWVKLHTGKQYRLTPYEHVLLITRGEVSL